MSERISEAADLWSRGHVAEALSLLTTEWGSTHDPELSELLQDQHRVIGARHPPIVAVGKKSAKKAWFEIAARRDFTWLYRLLKNLDLGTFAERTARLNALREWPPHPAIGEWLLGRFNAYDLAGRAKDGWVVALLALLEHQRDPALAPRLAYLLEQIETSGAQGRVGLVTLRGMSAALARMQSWPAAEPLSDAQRAGLMAFAKNPPAAVVDPRDDRLWAAVYAAPEDVPARLVLADRLTELGDPRGEFIALQVARHGTTRKASAREKTLLEQWKTEWLGPIGQFVDHTSVRFERGFPVTARLGYVVSLQQQIPSREWSTLNTLALGGHHSLLGDFLSTPDCRHLETVVELLPNDLFSRERPGVELPWRFAELFVTRLDPAELPREGRLKFPRLTTLELRSHVNFGGGLRSLDAFIAELACPALDQVVVNLPHEELTELIHRTRGVEIGLEDPDTKWTLMWHPTEARLTVVTGNSNRCRDVLSLLQRLRGQINRAELLLGSNFEPDSSTLALVRGSLRPEAWVDE